jgi:hypothetical protein
MLDVTVLKVEHQGVSEARKLIPYIEGCDIISPEGMAITREFAEKCENSWENLLDSGISRSRFLDSSEPRISLATSDQKSYADRVQG